VVLSEWGLATPCNGLSAAAFVLLFGFFLLGLSFEESIVDLPCLVDFRAGHQAVGNKVVQLALEGQVRVLERKAGKGGNCLAEI